MHHSALGDAIERFDHAYDEYWRTGRVPSEAAELLLRAAWSSGGTHPFMRARQKGRPFGAHEFSDLPTDLLECDLSTVVAALERDGLYVLPERLSRETVDGITRVFDHAPATPRRDGVTVFLTGPPSPSAPTWWVAPKDILHSSVVRRLIVQRRLVEVTGHYLRVEPLIMSVALWRSFPWRSADASSAQSFHYDNDRPAFLKFFVYLDDVDEARGPHVYVVGSHREKPQELLHGQRLPDRAIRRSYATSDIRVVTGERGTAFLADTSGFHKGERVRAGSRSMFQINLASDRFGIAENPVGRAPEEVPADLLAFVNRHPRLFSQLFVPRTTVA